MDTSVNVFIDAAMEIARVRKVPKEVAFAAIVLHKWLNLRAREVKALEGVLERLRVNG